MRDTAIRNTHSSVVTINNETDAWDTNGNVVVLDESAITKEITRLQAEYDAQEYARKRKAKYDALNQFELISDDVINGTTTHKDAVLAIKSAHPKPS
jgi:hypothetical protein|tara:strand:+ start:266 stop:556 length:291 start_codon:yes stop_codon:yes gene_type:complete